MPAGFIEINPSQLAFLIHAVKRHREFYRSQGMAPPEGLSQLTQALAGVREGQRVSSLDAPTRSVEVEAVKPVLVTYADAAAMLSVSLSTLKRRIAEGVIPVVNLGSGLRRIRVCDIHTYVQSLTPES